MCELCERSRRIAIAALLCVLPATFLAGCGSSGRGGNLSAEDRAASFVAHDDAFFEVGFRNQWKGVPFISRRSDVVHTLIEDDLVAVMDSASRLTLLDTRTGRAAWSRQLTDPLTEFVGLSRSGDRLLASTQTEIFSVSIPNGTILSRQPLERIVTSEPRMVGDMALFGTANGELLAQRSNLGFRAWGTTLGSSVSAQPAAIGNVIFAVSDEGRVLIVEADTGRRTGEIKIFGGPGSKPISGETYFYLASLDYSLYAFNPVGGDVVWRERTSSPITAQPIHHEGVVYIELEGQGFIAFDADTGRRLWVAPDVSGTAIGMSGRNLIVWDGSDAILLDPQRGDVISRTPLPNIETLTTDTFAGGNLYAISPEGVVARYEPRF